MLDIGTPAPDFTLPDENGTERSLGDYRGRKVILYFYSKDMTSGCSRQAEGFRDLHAAFEALNAVILGVSKDSTASHLRFKEKYALPFTLLSDTEKAAIGSYDVWQEKKNYGKTVMGVLRATYIIDEEGVIRNVVSKVRAADNPAASLAALKAL